MYFLVHKHEIIRPAVDCRYLVVLSSHLWVKASITGFCLGSAWRPVGPVLLAGLLGFPVASSYFLGVSSCTWSCPVQKSSSERVSRPIILEVGASIYLHGSFKSHCGPDAFQDLGGNRIPALVGGAVGAGERWAGEGERGCPPREGRGGVPGGWTWPQGE